MGLASIANSCFKNENRHKMKIFVYFLQIATSINRITFYNPWYLELGTEIFGSPSTSISVHAQCIFVTNPNSLQLSIPTVFSQRFLGILSPFLYWIAIVIISIILKKTKSIETKNHFFSTSFILLSLFLQPNILAQIAAVISCRQIGNHLYILADT